MTSMIIVKKIITITALFLGVFYLLRVIPKTPLEDRDALIISLVLVVAYLIFDNFIVRGEHLTPTTTTPPLPDALKPISTSVRATPVSQETPEKRYIPELDPRPIPEPSPVQRMEPPSQPTPASKELPAVEECTTCKVDLSDNKDVKKISNDEENLAYMYTPTRRYPSTGSRMEDGILGSDMPYTDYNTLPIGAKIDTKVDDFSYSFLPPDRWYPIPPHPPVCVAEKQCPVCPMNTTGTVASLKEWGEVSRVTPGDQVNSTYINEKLNSGR
jgi:hypothetical protein